MNLSEVIEIKTDRLLLRQWRSSDFDSFAKLNANKNVMAFYPNILTRTQSDELANTIQKRMAENKWGFWAVEIPEVCEFIGFVGLNRPAYDLPFEPGIEIGWRLSDQYWGEGYATEAAQAVLNIGFNRLNLTEIVAFASVLNTASINLMKRLHMHDTQYLFEHPKIPKGHKLREHCLYKITSQNWKTS